MLLAAKNPILWAGQGVHYAEAGDRLAALAELVPAPVVTHQSGQERDPREPSAVARRLDPLALEDVHRLHGQGRSRVRHRLEPDRTPFGPSVPPGKTIIHSTNDAGDINKEYRAEHALIGDAALVLDALIAEVARQKGGGGGNALTSLKEEIAAAKKAWQANGRSSSIPTRRRSTSTASSAT